MIGLVGHDDDPRLAQLEFDSLAQGGGTVADGQGQDELLALFREGDVLILLSVGGLNQCLIRRARAAGYPIITNGIDYSSAGMPPLSIIMVPRDSYGGLADAVIRLVDDEEYYRRFGSD